jgi:L-threonylcarbamoyladenylate synthase
MYFKGLPVMSSRFVFHSAANVADGMDLAQAARYVRAGGVLIFPTETFYGMGCLAAHAEAVARVYQLKCRPVHKPLPLLAAHATQVDEVAELAAMPRGLAAFWPGPLTVLLPARACLPQALVNAQGQVAVRVTPHPLAAQLAAEAGGVLTASSANLSGGAAVRSPQQLDPALLDALQRMAQEMPASASGNDRAQNQQPVLLGGPMPAGGLPSTVVEPLGCTDGGAGRLRMLRAGAVGVAELVAAGFSVE